jgi:nucleotide-binding universal stress UspA family protein
MYERILVPVDGGSETRGAVSHAIDIADKYDATVYVLHVVSQQLVGDTDELEADGKHITDEAVERATEYGVDVVGDVTDGRPSDRILGYADERNIDLVVMGTHGRTGVGRVLLGSVAERVARHSDVPVLLVRSPGLRTIDSEEEVIDIAKDALADEGYDDVSVTETPYRAANTWIVRAAANEETFNVHVDPATGETSVANIQPRE